MDRGAWRAIVHGVAESRRCLSDWAYGLQQVLNTGMMCLVGACKGLLPCVQNGSEKPRSKAGWPIRRVDDDSLGMPGSSHSGQKWVDSRNNWHNLLMGLDVVPVPAVGNTGMSEKGGGLIKGAWCARCPKIVFAYIYSFHLILCDFAMEAVLVLLWRKMVTCIVFYC